jgi:hypothetical protein
MTEWTFLTNHVRALVCIAHDPGVRLRDMAAALGITERSAFGIVTDLVAAGYIVKGKYGRRNRYEIQADIPLREIIGREQTIGELLALIAERGASVRPSPVGSDPIWPPTFSPHTGSRGSPNSGPEYSAEGNDPEGTSHVVSSDESSGVRSVTLSEAEWGDRGEVPSVGWSPEPSIHPAVAVHRDPDGGASVRARGTVVQRVKRVGVGIANLRIYPLRALLNAGLAD